jgi:hypothetical protein
MQSLCMQLQIEEIWRLESLVWQKNAIWSLFWLGKNNEKQRTWAHRENAHPKERCKSAVEHSAPNLLDRLLRQNGLFLEFSLVLVLVLCVSRACLGKMIVFIHKWRKKTVLTHLGTLIPCRQSGRQGGQRLFQARLLVCLFRACPGKLIIFR